MPKPAYELWEMRTGNLMGSFPSQEEALSVLATALKAHGLQYADHIALTWEYGDESKDVASGQALAKLALTSLSR
jgi:hypothetical protein